MTIVLEDEVNFDNTVLNHVIKKHICKNSYSNNGRVLTFRKLPSLLVQFFNIEAFINYLEFQQSVKNRLWGFVSTSQRKKKWLDNCRHSLGCATICTLSSVFCTIFTPSPDLLFTNLRALNTKTFMTNTSDSGNKTVKYDWEYAVKRIFANVLIRKAEISGNNLTSELYTALWKRFQGRATNVSFPILNSFTSCKWDDKLWQYID